ncbi:MAG: NAD(P)H-dependent oxidoreductase subunit E [Anaerolineales bacterium]|nr:NAD(P)H-dependent oxidoreductase subunit E [Anaerolineales bacterium]
MIKVLENIANTDPLMISEQRAIIDRVLAENKNLPGATMVVLNELQSQIGFISVPMQGYVAQKLRVPMSEINGVVSFYSFFTTTPRGKHTVKFCLGTACYVGGAPGLIEKTKQIIGVDPGETTEDGSITVEVCRCIGACSQAPTMVIDKDMYGRMHPNKLPQILNKYQ